MVAGNSFVQFMSAVGAVLLFVLFLFSRALIDDGGEARGNDAGGNSDDADAHQRNYGGKGAPDRSDGVDVAISHRRQRADSPPQGADDVWKLLRLHGVFHSVHDDGRKQHHEDTQHNGYDQLRGGLFDHAHDDVQRLKVPAQLEHAQKPENSKQPNHPGK